MVVVTILPDGRTLVTASITNKFIATGSGNVSVTFPELRTVEYLISHNVHTTVATNVSVINHGIAGNVAGLTINVGTNTTIFGDLFAIGF